ncbi:uncharacterized protein LOC130265497 [Oenanthe melanoleuca]|uniref:uncharacterized protein LOC130265497 n=1 Tax=Oenanthe melanoleuca TaxID=2939378 RepID=UPI0024C1AAD4|nr:uncharacterized protein LOC130265497 [Oenanthe melanoleuca]
MAQPLRAGPGRTRHRTRPQAPRDCPPVTSWSPAPALRLGGVPGQTRPSLLSEFLLGDELSLRPGFPRADGQGAAARRVRCLRPCIAFVSLCSPAATPLHPGIPRCNSRHSSLNPLHLSLHPLHLSLHPLHPSLHPLHPSLQPLHLSLQPLHPSLQLPALLTAPPAPLTATPATSHCTPCTSHCNPLHPSLQPPAPLTAPPALLTAPPAPLIATSAPLTAPPALLTATPAPSVPLTALHCNPLRLSLQPLHLTVSPHVPPLPLQYTPHCISHCDPLHLTVPPTAPFSAPLAVTPCTSHCVPLHTPLKLPVPSTSHRCVPLVSLVPSHAPLTCSPQDTPRPPVPAATPPSSAASSVLHPSLRALLTALHRPARDLLGEGTAHPTAPAPQS